MSGSRLILFAFAAVTAAAQSAVISALPQTLTPGQGVVTSLSLVSAGQAIAAIQFDLQWDAPLSVQFTLGNQPRSAGKLPYVAPLGTRSVRCLITGMNETTIADGELIKLFVSADPAALADSAQVSIVNALASSPDGTAISVTASPVAVGIEEGAAPASISPDAILNAASLSSGPLSPGEIITLLGVDASGNVSMLVNGLPAPLLYAGAGQVNAVVPFGLALNSPALLQLRNDSGTVSATLPVAPASPALFSANGTGFGPGAILNQDYSFNSLDNPADPGSVVFFYGTGFGPLQATPADGQPVPGANATMFPVSATVSGLPAVVLYSGAAPELIAGMTQVNIQLPGALAHNPSAPITLSVAGSSTANTVTVAIR